MIDIGPGAGEEGGRIVATGLPATVAACRASRTGPYLARALGLPVGQMTHAKELRR